MVAVDDVELLVERKIAAAIERGELDPGALKGTPIADLDRPRQSGWWADEFVRRERSRFTGEDAAAERGRWERRLARARDVDDLRRRVATANRWIDEVNGGLMTKDVVVRFDAADEIRRWHHRSSR